MALMTQDEYREYLEAENRKVLARYHRNSPPGTQVKFSRFFGDMTFVKRDDGWVRLREIQSVTDQQGRV